VRVVVASPAQQEFVDAIDFYRDLAPGLARDLVDEFDRAISQIVEFPSSGAPSRHGARKIVLQRFPFALIYRLKPETAEVIAFAHQARRPGYWVESVRATRFPRRAGIGAPSAQRLSSSGAMHLGRPTELCTRRNGRIANSFTMLTRLAA
jgi:plasmid stabilization system protein ParE